MADETPVEEAVDQAQTTADLALDVVGHMGGDLQRALEEHGRRLDELAAGLGGITGRIDDLALRSHEHLAASEPEPPPAPATEPETATEAEDAGHMTVEVEAPPKPPKKRRRFE